MTTLIIKNIGPVKDAELNLNKVNVLMGPQSCGKSTIAKIISYCTWLEKDVSIYQSLEKYNKNNGFFKEKLENFYNLKGYFNINSFIAYKSEVVSFEYKSGQFFIRWEEFRYSYKRSKISYIPSERNIMILPELKKIALSNNNIRSFLFDWFDASNNYTKPEELIDIDASPVTKMVDDNSLNILNLGVSFYYDSNNNENHIIGKDGFEEYDILLSNASSGLQSIVPLMALADYLTFRYYNIEEQISFEQKEKRKNVIQNIIYEVIYKHYFALDNMPENGEMKTYNDIFTSKIDEDINAKMLWDKYNEVVSNIFSTHSSHFIIEEPEQNLFPETQRDLIYYLLEKCQDKDRDHHLTITTHSPYILYAINNCMMGGLVYNKMEDDSRAEISCKHALIEPGKVSIYQIDNGVLKTIQEKDGIIGSNYFDQKMKELMDDFYVFLKYYGDEN